MIKDSFIFYRSFFEALKGMEAEIQGKCLMALSNYALNGVEPSQEPEVMMFFTLAKPQIDANNKRFMNGCKGGRPKKPNENQTITETKPNNNQNKTEVEPNVNVNVNVNDIKKENIIKEKKQTKPSLEDVKQYCEERKNNVDACKWYDYYSSNGWKVGKNTMKDWRACVRTWERNAINNTQQQEESENIFIDSNFKLDKEMKDFKGSLYKLYPDEIETVKNWIIKKYNNKTLSKGFINFAIKNFSENYLKK